MPMSGSSNATAGEKCASCRPGRPPTPTLEALFFHAPEVIGRGKARAPYGFGAKDSIVTANACSPGGHFVLRAAALPGNP